MRVEHVINYGQYDYSELRTKRWFIDCFTCHCAKPELPAPGKPYFCLSCGDPIMPKPGIFEVLSCGRGYR